MHGLPTARNDGRSSRSPKKLLKRIGKEVMRSQKFKLPKYDLPLRLRPVSAQLQLRVHTLTDETCCSGSL